MIRVEVDVVNFPAAQPEKKTERATLAASTHCTANYLDLLISLPIHLRLGDMQ